MLSIAGFDPSGGAGVLADCKTFEALETYGFGICSAITYQNDVTFQGVEWLQVAEMELQLELLANRFDVSCAKIGLIQDLEQLDVVTNRLRELWPEIKIVWDPILAASSGFVFHESMDFKVLQQVAQKFALITPNLVEIEKLAPGALIEDKARELARVAPVLLKGGHAKGFLVTDIFFSGDNREQFESPRHANAGKHGSGCVLSAAIAAHLARGCSLQSAIEGSRAYTEKFLLSNKTALGFHGTL